MTGSASGARVLVIGTPIGNLGDLSPRAREALDRCDVIACEDTRRTGKLLELSGIRAPRLVRLDAHTERRAAQGLVDSASRESWVLGVASDAGMPGLSDPGAVLVDLAIEAGLVVEVVPGPFAGAVALVASGLLTPDSRFVFEGFLPRKTGERQRRLAEVSSDQRPLVLYESPNRVRATLRDIAAVMGDGRRLSVSRELTKMHEQTLRGTAAQLVETFERSEPRGEFVIVVEGAAPPPPASEDELLESYWDLIDGGVSSRDAVSRVAEMHGVNTNLVKRLVFSSKS